MRMIHAIRRDVEGYEKFLLICEQCSRGKQGCSIRCEKYYDGHWLQHHSLGGGNQFNNRYQPSWWNGVTKKWLNGKMWKSILLNGDIMKPRTNDDGASELCMFDISVVWISYYLLRKIRQQEWQKDVCDKTIQCCTLWCSSQPFPSLLWVIFPNPFNTGSMNEIRTSGASFLCKKGSRV